MNMRYITELFSNIFVLTALASWAEAQVLKTIIHAIVNKKFDITRLFGDGGMPSGHSATVTSLAACVGLVKGLDSVEFAIAGIVAVVVCHDARGVRLETGKQSTILNEMQKTLKLLTSQELPEVKLKEFVGHTPTQVAAGIIMGIVNAIIVYNLFT
ncbi:divergent PAP2 family protein [Ruminococcus albus]|jgi:acid phosphatase family membrane protein YuiD|uniref:divergent PAP2 family protein n=1 Tax=Ruminococcus albus TaxID=1264 RepID=UPI001FA7C9EB|nr:divergent PAP2 family protein [Ruminococcus albus]